MNADALAPETLALAKALIGRKSLTPEDAGCQAIIAERLQPLGFAVEWVNSSGVTNSWMRRGTAAPLLCFAGHTDVVPTGPEWEWHGDPFIATEKNGKLYGRGVADMKVSVAAFVTAAERFVHAHPHHKGSIALLLTSDEEGPATDGTVKVVERLKARGERIDYCIVGEPSSTARVGDVIKNGRRGSLSGRLVVKGVQGHVAYPHLAKNPIHLVAPAIAELATTEWDQGNEFFPPTTFQVSNVRSGTGALNVIPGTIAIDFNFRFSTASTEQDLRERVERVLKQYALDYELTWTLGGRPFLTQKGALINALTQAIQAVSGISSEISTTGGTSDGRFIADICPEVAELGPTNHSIHKINEYVAIEEIGAVAAVYYRTLVTLLG